MLIAAENVEERLPEPSIHEAVGNRITAGAYVRHQLHQGDSVAADVCVHKGGRVQVHLCGGG